MYRGTLRLLLVLLHDFPEFLSEYYFSLCDVIPPRCIQLRNIVLSAYPPNVTLPDPNLRDIDFDAIPGMGPIPPILSDFTASLRAGELRGYLDQYLLNRAPQATFLASLKDRLRTPAQDSTGEVYNLPLINSLVMYIGVSSVAQARARSGSPLFVPTDAGVVALHYLATNLDAEGTCLACINIKPLSHDFSRSTPPSQRNGPAPALPQRAYPLVQLLDAVPIPRDPGRSIQRDRHQGSVGTIPRPPPPSVGRARYVHRAAQEP